MTDQNQWPAWGDEPAPAPTPRDGTISLLWMKLRRLAGTRPSTPTDDMEGQLRYERDGAVDGALYLARMLKSTAYQWSKIMLIRTGTPTAALAAAAGTTATYTINGNDTFMRIQVVPGGTGITTGNQITVTFGNERPSTSYVVIVTPASNAARTLGGVVGAGTTNTTDFTFNTNTALTSGSTYVWHVFVHQYD